MKKILVIVAHYDDAELMFGGIINHCVKMGFKVELLIITNGSSWITNRSDLTNDISKIRSSEQKNACKELGISKLYELNVSDGFVEYDRIVMPILKTIRKSNPNIILTHSPTEFHNDHKVVFQVVNRLCNSIDEPPPICNPYILPNVRPVINFNKLFYYARCSDINSPNIYFHELDEQDILKKCKALQNYKTQTSVINSLEKIKNEARFYGGLVGCEYCEILIEQPVKRYNVVKSLQELL